MKINTINSLAKSRWFWALLLSMGLSSGQASAQSCSNLWSAACTWGGTVPAAGANVTVPAGRTITYDLSTAVPYGTLTINGSLIFDQTKDLALTAHKINLAAGGTFQIGTQASPYTRRAVITLNGPRSAITTTTSTEHNALVLTSAATRIFNSQGNIQIWGHLQGVQKTKLVQHAQPGTTTFQVEHPLFWRTGDRIAVSITDFYGTAQTEIFTLAQDTNGGQTITTTTPLQAFRWGRAQYVCNTPVNGNHLSLTPCAQSGAAVVQTNHPLTPTYLDQRATIVRLSRNITFQGADDTDWNGQGFGATMMIMNKDTSTTRINGLEFLRVGQRRILRMYPFHWHMLSFTAANSSGVGGGQFLGNVAPYTQELMNSSFHQSENRAAVIHGTSGALVYNTYAVDIKGHAFFIEDGVETGNILLDNVAMKVRAPAQPLKVHEFDDDAGDWAVNASSGFWITNPLNAVAFNTASDCGRGLWNSFANRAFGEARNAQVVPSSLPFGINLGNNMHSNRLQGMTTEFAVTDEAGNVGNNWYTGSGGIFMWNSIWKNLTHGYQNRVGHGIEYTAWSFADNNRKDMTGQALTAVNNGGLFVAKSLNSATPFSFAPKSGVSSYHASLDHKNIVVVNYEFEPPVISGNYMFVHGGGFFDSADNYLLTIGLGMNRNPGWVLRNSNAGYLTPSPHFDGFPLCATHNGQLKCRNWSVAGAMQDTHGYWGAAGRYLLPAGNRPFYAHGLTDLVDIAPAGQNGKSTATPFYGFGDVVIDADTNAEGWGSNQGRGQLMERLDANNNVIDHHRVDSYHNSFWFQGFRYFALARGGTYKMSYVDGTPAPTSRLRVNIDNAYRSAANGQPADNFVVGLPWSGSVPVKGKIDVCTISGAWYGHAQRLTNGNTREITIAGANLNAVKNDPTGSTFFQDSANNTVWIKYMAVPNLSPWCSSYNGNSDTALNKSQWVVLSPASAPWP
jgi:hypothetical protein